MKSKNYFVLLVLAALCAGILMSHGEGYAKEKPAKKTSPVAAGGKGDQNKFNLKPGAAQKVCLTCHPAFEDMLKKSFVHTPVKSPGCKACHNPHTSHFPKQLSAEGDKVCSTCHPGMMAANAKSMHKPVLEGKCLQCHDPHSSNNKANLLRAGSELCFGCHKDKAEAFKKTKFKHSPVERSCLNCHNPHASADATALLKKDAPGLCLDCHETSSANFVKRHSNYPVAKANCTKCHSVHGSNSAGLIHDTVHKPFLNKQCNQCHENANSPNPLALKKKGFELCRGCHNSTVNDAFSKNRVHWPVVGKDGCLNCHSPHASPSPGLLSATPVVVCGKCHADTIDRQEKSISKHKPIKDGQCTACHSPHSSDNVFLITEASSVKFCGTCHDYMKHATHPIGEKVIDKRNKNLMVDCSSCHLSHGTEFRKMLPFGTVTELCTQCHLEYQR